MRNAGTDVSQVDVRFTGNGLYCRVLVRIAVN